MELRPGKRAVRGCLNSRESRSTKGFMKTVTPGEVRSGLLLAGMLTVCSLLTGGAAETASHRVKVEPRESDELLANPGMGWQTFHRFADEDQNLQGLPSASAYFRFYWREVEPQDGQIDFAKFDGLLAHARRAGQKLAFRIMCTGSGAIHGRAGLAEGAGLPRGRVQLRRRQALGARFRRPALSGQRTSA